MYRQKEPAYVSDKLVQEKSMLSISNFTIWIG